MKKTEREAKAEEITRTARAMIQAEEISRRRKTERLRKLRESMAEGKGGKPAKPADARH